MTDKDNIIQLMSELRDKVQDNLYTMRHNKDTIKYLDMSWLAHGIMEDASSIQFKCSDLAVELEGAKK